MKGLDFDQLFERFADVKIGVLGDIMLDTYCWGNVERISPEAPVPVVALTGKEHRIGGAGNVALNLAALGAQVSMITITGKDDDGMVLANLLDQHQIDTAFSIQDENRITTCKTRIISRNQQMMRLDAEVTNDLSTEQENMLLENIEQYLQIVQPNALVFEDYNKGLLTKRVIETTIELCKKYDVLTAVDPKKKNFLAYQEVTIFKPNLKEVREGLNIHLEQVDLQNMQAVHQVLQEHLRHHVSFITLSEKGVFYQNETGAAIIPSHIRNIADVSGAGDTVIAVASLIYAVTRDVALMAKVANIAGGLVCEEVGTAPIEKSRLLDECKLLIMDN